MVLINDTVKKYLLKQPTAAREKIREKFEFLETGIWDGGLKVKKLKGGSSKYLFEARLDRGNRILFTLGHRGDTAAAPELMVYVWGIVVHDDVSKKIKTIIPDNAPFLQFRDYEEVLLDNVDMEELEPAYFTQESITEKTSGEAGSQRWYEIDEPEWKRIQMYTRDDFELFLHLTPQQKEILQAPLPLLVSGTAGSGKTSLGVYYLLNRNLNKKKKLFITYNDHLREFARKLYNGLLNDREWKHEVIPPVFYTFKELCLEMTADGSRDFLPGNEVDFNRFHRLYAANPMIQVYDAALVWEEVRAVIKGAARVGADRQYLTFQQYEALGKKKAPNFKFSRKDIYSICQWYQNKLEGEGLWDESDLTSRALAKAGKKYTCDILVCDEVQDFTDSQLELLFRLVKNPKNMFLAGDTKQTINPSGFRWEEVRQHFYRRKIEIPELKLEVPGLRALSLNFRSSGSIVELSNLLLELKEKFTGRQADEIKEEWKYKGRPVTVVSGIDTRRMLDLLKTAGADRTILVRTEGEKEKLKKHLDTELVFTIKEAKGLEFETVVLWKFCHDEASESRDVWKAVLDLSSRSIHEAKIKHEINLLYVGITRAVQNLVIYDGEAPSIIWESIPLKNNVYITHDYGYIEEIWNVVTTPEEWVKKGHYFFEREFYKAAVECFKNGGDLPGLSKARAFYFQQTGNYSEAALNFESVGEGEKAAANYEKAGQYEKALVLWGEIKNRERETLCRAALLKREKKYREAGQLYLQTGDYEAAVESYKKARDYGKAAEVCLEYLDDMEKAAHYYESAGDFGKAAELYTRLQLLDNAAELYYTLKNYPKAEALWEKSGNTRQLMRLYGKTGQHQKLLLIYEKEENLEKTVKYLEKLDIDKEDLKKQARGFLEKQEYFKALVRFYAADDPGGIAQCYYKMGKYREAVDYFEKSGDLRTAADLYFKIGEYQGALTASLHDNQDKNNNYAMAGKCLEKIQDRGFLYLTAVDCYHDENYAGALLLFDHLGGFEPLAGICYALRGEEEKALAAWSRCRYYGQCVVIAEECKAKELVELGTEFFLKIAAGQTSVEKYAFAVPLEESTVTQLLDDYFNDREKMSHKTHREKIGAWGNFIRGEDRDYRNAELVFSYLEANDDYDYLVFYIKEFEKYARQDKDEMERFREMVIHYCGEIPSLAASFRYEAAAFRHFLLGEKEALTRLLSKVPITGKNYVLFIAAKGDFSKKVVEFCKENERMAELNETLERLKVLLEDMEEEKKS